MCSKASSMRTSTAFTVESMRTRSAHAKEFVPEAKPAAGPGVKCKWRSVVTASAMSHRSCEVSPKIDGATAVTMSRSFVGGNPTNVRTRLSTERENTMTTHQQAQHELAL